MITDSSKSTILVIATGFLALYLIFSWQWAIICSLIVGVIGIFSPSLSKKIDWLWMKLSLLLSYIVPNIILSIVYYLILFPIAIIYKLFNNDPLMLSHKYSTYFMNVNKKMDKKSFEKIW